VLPNSWLGGFKAAAAAVAQVKAEQRHIKQALLQRQGLLPPTKASLFGFGGGSNPGRTSQQPSSAAAAAAAAVCDKNVTSSSTAKGAAGGSSSSRTGSGRSKSAAVVVDSSKLSTQLLHIPEAALQQLKVSCCAAELNDCLTNIHSTSSGHIHVLHENAWRI
jgi:hypothetical protein